MRIDVNEALEVIVTEELDRLAYDLVELRTAGSRARPTLQLRIDRRDGAPITVSDCAIVSRAVETRLEAEKKVGPEYVLEVSSPGIERPLHTVADWRRFVGQRASVLSPALQGRAEVEIVGVEGNEGAESVVIRTAQGIEQRIALADVKDARLAFTW
ncbi:MAG: ribosome maturation factor RimP [Gemmatimonadaceae bacterium]|nr:ribosome maturation factor RimP [Gemmatimonadaceae bacterium]